ncbi:hypothetical protein BJ165DRAFT_1406951 [Panaeolus papilionaceus]|nr:hypothetical protein BJ165DRAFT_1406951 [Panaeolus papilionaceus]
MQAFKLSSILAKSTKTGRTVPCGTPVSSTAEDPTTTSLFAEDKSLNASKAKVGERGDKTKVDAGAVEGVGSGEGEGGYEGVEEVLCGLGGMSREVDWVGEVGGGGDKGGESV